MQKPFLFFLLSYSVVASAVTVDEALTSAFRKNESIEQGRQQVRQVEEQISQAKGLVYPKLSLEGTHLIQPELDDPVAASFFPEEQTTVSVQLNQPLFRGGREFAAIRQRKNILEAQKQARVSSLLQVYVGVTASYLNVLSLEQDLKNLNEQRDIYATRVKQLQGRANRGESSSSEVLTAQSTSASLDAEVQLVQSQLVTARENFAVLTGLAADTVLNDKVADAGALAESSSADVSKPAAKNTAKAEPANEVPVFTLKPLNEYLARIEENPEIKSIKEQVEASDEEVSIAKGGHWPTADLTGNYYLQRPDGITKDLKWDVQFKVSFPLFEGGLRNAQVREAASKKSVADLELARLRRAKEAEIRGLYENLRMRNDQLAALKKSAELSERNYKVVLRDSRFGLTRSVDVQMALTEYRTIRRAYDQARFQARLDLVKLDAATLNLPPVVMKEI